MDCLQLDSVMRIDRATRWGNKYKDETRSCNIADFEANLRGRMSLSVDLRKAVAGMAGKTLACWCAPRPCHGHVYVYYADWFAENPDLIENPHVLPEPVCFAGYDGYERDPFPLTGEFWERIIEDCLASGLWERELMGDA